MLLFVPLFQSLSKGDGEYKLLIVFVPRADFSISPLERKRERLKRNSQKTYGLESVPKSTKIFEGVAPLCPKYLPLYGLSAGWSNFASTIWHILIPL